jgi:hypothetical protein
LINATDIIKQTGSIVEIKRGFNPLTFHSTGDDTDKTPAPSSQGIFTDKTNSDHHLNFKPTQPSNPSQLFSK